MSSSVVFQFCGIDCCLEKGSYQHKGRDSSARLSLRVVAANSQHNRDMDIVGGEPVTTASINVVSEPLRANEVVIKNYDNNEGLLPVLVSAGLVKRTGRQVPTGMVFSEIVLCLI